MTGLDQLLHLVVPDVCVDRGHCLAGKIVGHDLAYTGDFLRVTDATQTGGCQCLQDPKSILISSTGLINRWILGNGSGLLILLFLDLLPLLFERLFAPLLGQSLSINIQSSNAQISIEFLDRIVEHIAAGNDLRITFAYHVFVGIFSNNLQS